MVFRCVRNVADSDFGVVGAAMVVPRGNAEPLPAVTNRVQKNVQQGNELVALGNQS